MSSPGLINVHVARAAEHQRHGSTRSGRAPRGAPPPEWRTVRKPPGPRTRRVPV